MGLFHPFFSDERVQFIGVEAAGKGLESSEHSATLTKGDVGILHGSKSRVLQDADGQVKVAHSIAAGLDYPGVGPEHCMLKDIKRLEIATATDKEALNAFDVLSREEGIIPALESSHAVAHLLKEKAKFRPDDLVVVNLSGRGDKDVETVSKLDLN